MQHIRPMGLLDKLRDRGWRAIAQGDGAIASAARRVNDTLGRPLASAEELADREAFATGYGAKSATHHASATAAPEKTEVAPVIVYYSAPGPCRKVFPRLRRSCR